MENALNMILNAENVRTLVTIVSVFCGVVWLKMSIKNIEHRMDKLEFKTEASINELKRSTEASIKDIKLDDLASIHKRIDEVEVSLGKRIDELKCNDFAHLSSAFKALTYVLEKNGSLSKADKEYVDNSLQGDA